jgi:hypothetical protein
MLEGRNFAERMPPFVIGGWTSRCENVDRDKFVIDTLLLEREADGPHVDAVGRAEHDGVFNGCHRAPPVSNVIRLRSVVMQRSVVSSEILGPQHRIHTADRKIGWQATPLT